jgi:hypothetical protein
MTNPVPEEIATAVAAYEAEHARIRDRVKANRRRYRGTKYEGCPPLLLEELALMVRRSEVLEEQQRLDEHHGACPRHWAFAVVWFRDRKQNRDRGNASIGHTRKRKVPNKVAPRDAKKRRA